MDTNAGPALRRCRPAPQHTNKWKQMETNGNKCRPGIAPLPPGTAAHKQVETNGNKCRPGPAPLPPGTAAHKQMEANGNKRKLHSQVKHARGRIQRHRQAARPSEMLQLGRVGLGTLEHFVQRSAGAVLYTAMNASEEAGTRVSMGGRSAGEAQHFLACGAQRIAGMARTCNRCSADQAGLKEFTAAVVGSSSGDALAHTCDHSGRAYAHSSELLTAEGNRVIGQLSASKPHVAAAQQRTCPHSSQLHHGRASAAPHSTGRAAAAQRLSGR